MEVAPEKDSGNRGENLDERKNYAGSERKYAVEVKKKSPAAAGKGTVGGKSGSARVTKERNTGMNPGANVKSAVVTAERFTERTAGGNVKPVGVVAGTSSVIEDDGWKWDRVELNSADSAALVELPGIGPYYARKILYYRSRLWGCFADKRQLLEITGIDNSVYNKFEDRIYIEPSSIHYINLYKISEDSLAKHPYIGYYAARGIATLRRMVPENEFTVDTLVSSKILSEEQAARLCRYIKK